MNYIVIEKYPTYGELLDYLKDAEFEAATTKDHCSVAVLLVEKLLSDYPSIYIGRAG